MPTKPQITEEEIICAAYEIAKKEGIDAVKSTGVAKKLNMSVQPLYYNLRNMDALKDIILLRALKEYSAFLRRENVGLPKEEWLAYNYFTFAKENPHLFRMIFIDARKSVKERIKCMIEENKNYSVNHIIEVFGVEEAAADEIYAVMGIFCQGIAFDLISENGALPDEEYRRYFNNLLEKLVKN